MKVGFFQESEGVDSMMRLLSFCSFWASVIFGFLTMRTPEEAVAAQSMGTWLTIAFLIGAFAPKGIQKIAELKLGVECNGKDIKKEEK